MILVCLIYYIITLGMNWFIHHHKLFLAMVNHSIHCQYLWLPRWLTLVIKHDQQYHESPMFTMNHHS